jgi:hypothetical protein
MAPTIGQAGSPGLRHEAHAPARVDRALADWSITGSKLSRTFGFAAKGRGLRPRLRQEAERRGQPVPKVNL